MPIAFEEIEAAYIEGASIPFERPQIICAFKFVERMLGLDWIRSRLTCRASDVPGWPCLDVLSIAQDLWAVAEAPGLSDVLRKICDGDHSARSELTAAAICVGGDPQHVKVEFGVQALVDGRPKVPDFRVRKNFERWTWVEVHQPQESEAQGKVDAVNAHLGKVLFGLIPPGRSTEILIERFPTAPEIEAIERCVRESLNDPLPSQRQLADFAIVISNVPSNLMPDDGKHRLSVAHIEHCADGQLRLLLIRHAFEDARLIQILQKEGRQLPRQEPCLVMLDSWNAWGRDPDWLKVIRRRFQPTVHTRISAVALFLASFSLVPAGGKAPLRVARAVTNPYADVQAPTWLLDNFAVLIPAHAIEKSSG
jgi:hypothetical protein